MREVTEDLFGVARRLREIDEYIVFWNGEKFEIWARGERAFSWDGVLDERVLWKARETRVENLDFSEIMKHNELIRGSAARQMETAISELREKFEFAHQTSSDVTFEKLRRQI